ncbi:peptidase M16 domain protein [Gloeothece citriformis PCC 7424]|uniref:Peptidase M16 domain protein n=1 Tax=Gloeothece citriformis (strain PCC 7424) TaxID=65393 RepID=B7KGS6_GLOC7|nr:pitrilysin family protein [Gloeothece citriformis]ACK72003.1 peptidase M16 domain protein [Gloeothece citriformis PCC 7424]
MRVKENHQTVHRLILDNGIILLLVENPAADLIAGRIFLKNAGSRWENQDKAGLFHLLATVITKGTETLSSVEIAEKVESVGANLGADATSDYFVLSLKTVSSDFPVMLGLIEEIMRSPTFPESEVELEKHLTQQNIRSQQEQPFNVAFKQLREAMYEDHPYGYSILGTEETVTQLTRNDLQQCHQTFFRPDNFVISLSGRLTLEEGIKLVEQTFGHWEIPQSELPSPQVVSLNHNPTEKITYQDTQQSIIMLGYTAAPVKNADYSVLKLLSTYLGNGLSSRLFVELREKRGLAYDVSCFYPTRLETSQFVIYMGTAPHNTTIGIEGLRAEAERLCHTELTPEEVQAAKNKLLGQYALGKQTNSEIAHLYGWYETLGLGINFDIGFQEEIDRITPQMIQEVAQKYLMNPYLSLVGPASAIES